MKTTLLCALCGMTVLYVLPATANNNLLGGKGKSARQIKQEKAAKRSSAAKKHAVSKKKSANLSKTVDIKGLAGYKFWDRSIRETATFKLDKPAFTRYDTIEVGVSPSVGVCSLTLRSNDPILSTKEQLKGEVSRVAAIFANRFGFSFSSDVALWDDSQTGYVSAAYAVASKKAEYIMASQSEDFKNCTLTIKGTRDVKAGVSLFEINVSMKAP